MAAKTIKKPIFCPRFTIAYFGIILINIYSMIKQTDVKINIIAIAKSKKMFSAST